MVRLSRILGRGALLGLFTLTVLGSQARASLLIDHFLTPSAGQHVSTAAPSGPAFNGAVATGAIGGTREATVTAASGVTTSVAFDVPSGQVNSGIATITSGITQAETGATSTALLVWDAKTTDGAGVVTPNPGFGPMNFLTAGSSIDSLLSFTNPTAGAGSVKYTLYNANGNSSTATATIPFTNGLFQILSVPLAAFTGNADLTVVTAVTALYTDIITTSNPPGASYNIAIDFVQVVPEPATVASALSGVMLLGLLALRRAAEGCLRH